jgi:hypothetical protein
MESASLRSDYPVVARWDSRNVVAAVRREVHDTFAIKDQRKIVKKCVEPYAATEVGRTRTVSPFGAVYRSRWSRQCSALRESREDQTLVTS